MWPVSQFVQDAVESAQCEPTQVSPPQNLAFVSSSFQEDIWFAVAALALSTASGSAQSQTERPQFDAASVKVNEPADRPSTRYDPVRIDFRKASIKHLIRRAWPLPATRSSGPHGSKRSARGYDVSVTLAPVFTTGAKIGMKTRRIAGTAGGKIVGPTARRIATRMGPRAQRTAGKRRSMQRRPQLTAEENRAAMRHTAASATGAGGFGCTLLFLVEGGNTRSDGNPVAISGPAGRLAEFVRAGTVLDRRYMCSVQRLKPPFQGADFSPSGL